MLIYITRLLTQRVMLVVSFYLCIRPIHLLGPTMKLYRALSMFLDEARHKFRVDKFGCSKNEPTASLIVISGSFLIQRAVYKNNTAFMRFSAATSDAMGMLDRTRLSETLVSRK